MPGVCPGVGMCEFRIDRYITLIGHLVIPLGYKQTDDFGQMSDHHLYNSIWCDYTDVVTCVHCPAGAFLLVISYSREFVIVLGLWFCT